MTSLGNLGTPFSTATAADISPDGRFILIRSSSTTTGYLFKHENRARRLPMRCTERVSRFRLVLSCRERQLAGPLMGTAFIPLVKFRF